MLAASHGPLHSKYDAALLDLDGVLYLGTEPVAHAAEAVAAARAAGMRAAFVTNNASRRPAAVAEHLTQLDIPAEAVDVVTSGQAAVRWVRARVDAGARVLVVGTEDLADLLRDQGLEPVRTADGAAAVVQGLATTTSWTDLAEASVAIRAGALWVAGNADATYPTVRGPLPGNGALVQALVTATGQTPAIVGKPEPELHAASVERVGALRPLVVGDRLDTDVLGAVRGGADSLLVLTGVTDREALLAAPADRRPTYVSSDLRGLGLDHPAPVVAGDTARCGAGGAHRRGNTVVPDDDSDDALRAACALAWSAAADD